MRDKVDTSICDKCDEPIISDNYLDQLTYACPTCKDHVLSLLQPNCRACSTPVPISVWRSYLDGLLHCSWDAIWSQDPMDEWDNIWLRAIDKDLDNDWFLEANACCNKHWSACDCNYPIGWEDIVGMTVVDGQTYLDDSPCDGCYYYESARCVPLRKWHAELEENANTGKANIIVPRIDGCNNYRKDPFG